MELSQGYLFHRPEPLDAMLYRADNDLSHPRECETEEERNAMIEKWLER